MNISLKDKTALVCGSTQGIGLAIAQELASLGASCILLARNETSLREKVKTLDSVSGQVHRYAVADFTDPKAVEAVANSLTGMPPVHILINNTGGPAPGQIQQAGPDLFLQAFQQHLVNYQQLTMAVLPGMKKAGYGRIINIISTSVKMPIPNLGVSNTIRAATAGWAKTLSMEVAAEGITVNNILPGFIKTARLQSLLETNAAALQISPETLAEKMQKEIPARRFGETCEIAALAAFLASPAASYINGTSIPVDGGKTGAF